MVVNENILATFMDGSRPFKLDSSAGWIVLNRFLFLRDAVLCCNIVEGGEKKYTEVLSLEAIS